MSRRIADPTLVDLDSKTAALVLEHYATAVKFGNRRSGKSIGYTRPGLNLAVVSDDKVTRVLHRRTNAGHSRLSDRLSDARSHVAAMPSKTRRRVPGFARRSTRGERRANLRSAGESDIVASAPSLTLPGLRGREGWGPP